MSRPLSDRDLLADAAIWTVDGHTVTVSLSSWGRNLEATCPHDTPDPSVPMDERPSCRRAYADEEGEAPDPHYDGRCLVIEWIGEVTEDGITGTITPTTNPFPIGYRWQYGDFYWCAAWQVGAESKETPA